MEQPKWLEDRHLHRRRQTSLDVNRPSGLDKLFRSEHDRYTYRTADSSGAGQELIWGELRPQTNSSLDSCRPSVVYLWVLSFAYRSF